MNITSFIANCTHYFRCVRVYYATVTDKGIMGSFKVNLFRKTVYKIHHSLHFNLHEVFK